MSSQPNLIVWRQSLVYLLPNIITVLVLLILDCFAFFVLMAYGWLGIAFFLIVAIAAIITAIRFWKQWWDQTIILDGQQLYFCFTKQKKVLCQRLSYNGIGTALSRYHGISGRLFHYGSVAIKDSQGKTLAVLRGISRPNQRAAYINSLLSDNATL